MGPMRNPVDIVRQPANLLAQFADLLASRTGRFRGPPRQRSGLYAERYQGLVEIVMSSRASDRRSFSCANLPMGRKNRCERFPPE
jgi:hypothetical protein